jgi:hypothetical protein
LRPIFNDIDMIPWSIARDDVDSRRNALYIINGAWGVFAFAFPRGDAGFGSPCRCCSAIVRGGSVISILLGAISCASFSARTSCGAWY